MLLLRHRRIPVGLMKKFRKLKHTFFTDRRVSDWPYSGRLLFLGLIANCDDFGTYRLSFYGAAGDIFPCDDIDRPEFGRMIATLWRDHRIYFYQSSREIYVGITHWERHQRIKKRVIALRNPPPSMDNALSLKSAFNMLAIPAEHLSESDTQRFFPDTAIHVAISPVDSAGCQPSADDDNDYDSESDSEGAPAHVDVCVANAVPTIPDATAIGVHVIKCINKLWDRRYRWRRKKHAIFAAKDFCTPAELLMIAAYISIRSPRSRNLDAVLSSKDVVDMWLAKIEEEGFKYDIDTILEVKHGSKETL